MKTWKAALFDLDGVLFDTEPQYTRFWGGEFRRYFPDRPGLEHAIKGQTLNQLFDQWFSGPLEAERAGLVRRLDAFERDMPYEYVPGALPFVDGLRARGILTAVVTSSNAAKMQSVYRVRPEFRDHFDLVLTAECFARSKPFPDGYLEAARRLGVAPSACVVIEDSLNGLRSGRAAGMTVVGLTTGHPAADIAPLSNLQIPDFRGLTCTGLLARL